MEPDKSQAGTNLVIVILVIIIVAVGVKLLMSTPVEAPAAAGENSATSTAGAPPAETNKEAEFASGSANGAASSLLAIGTGEVAFEIASPDAVIVREIFVHNPYRIGDPEHEWVQVYDGYRSVPAGVSTPVFTVSLATLSYDKVRVRVLSAEDGAPREVVKDMRIDVVPGGKTAAQIVF